MSSPSDVPLSVEAATVRWGEREALRDVSLSVRPGEFLAVAGPNGAGKSTLLRAVLGLAPLDSGRILLFGEPVNRLSARRRARLVAWVPQDESPRDNVPILDYVLYGRFAHLPPLTGESDEDRRSATQALHEVGLGDRPHEGILQLSGGERQRATLARALVQDAPLLLLDEPTAHLDIGFQLELLATVRRLVAERRVGVVAALHDLNLAARFADRIVVLSRGRVVADGTPADVLSPSLLGRVWGISAELRRDSRTDVPYLVPHRILTAEGPSPSRATGPIHVVGGGGSASRILQLLTDRGYELTAGALQLLDSDTETTQALGIPTAVGIPFAPLTDEVRAENRQLLGAARAVVVAPFAVGPSNLSNLEDLVSLLPGTPVYLVSEPPIEERDFSDGDGARMVRRLIAAGAHPVKDVAELLGSLAALTPRPAVGSGPARAAG